ncbi:hypothetical protein CWATWH0402_5943 [Crocosphaera watsonii WH 0402]|uniref:Uncharacterized protein n=1 Tax=Crocosphaera watsonii WH 0402 TaxID=1284629 RepID=T2JTG8_CROWT|nr:hypothetical protein CWATWH0402_5943 [Crocosphaera watsonii WH 0402]
MLIILWSSDRLFKLSEKKHRPHSNRESQNVVETYLRLRIDSKFRFAVV